MNYFITFFYKFLIIPVILQKICIFANSNQLTLPTLTMNERTILVALAILPVLVLGGFVYYKDKFQKEPLGMLVKAFFLGCVSAFPAILLEGLLARQYLLFGGEEMSGVLGGFYNGFIVAGFSEELCKLLLLYIAVWRSQHFDEYFDGIVYATFVSLGFAGIENVMYVFGQETYESALMTGTMRAILAVPGHFLFGVAMGYYFALAKFQPEQRWRNLVLALFVPMLLHGTYDALLMVPEAVGVTGGLVSGVLFVAFVIFDICLWKIGMRKLRNLQEMSRQQSEQTSESESFNGFNWDV